MIYICIPAHNEDRTIGVLLWKVRQVLANFPRDYQILVADDASTDATAEVLGPYERVLPLAVFRNSERRGYATSLEMLLREAVKRSEYPKRDVVVTLQADFTEDPEDIVAMLKRIEAGADVVCGETTEPDAALPRSYRWARRISRYLAGRRPLPEGVTDAMFGLRVYRVLVLKKALDARQGGRLMTWDGWAANAELLQQVQPHSRRTEALPVALRTERLQRVTRFDFWDTLKQAWGMSRGRSGPLDNVALPQPGSRQSGSTPAQARGRHGTRRIEGVSNGAGQRAVGNGQRGRGGPEERGRESRETRPRRTREGQEQRPEPPQRRPRREAQEPRAAGQEPGAPGQEPRTPGQEPRTPGQEPRTPGQEPRPRREGQQQRPRREAGERRQQRPVEPVLLDGELPQSAAPEAVTGEGAPAPAPRKRSRRRRRGGGAAAQNAQNAGAQSEMFEPTPGILEPGVEAAGEEVETTAGEGGLEGEPAKRRRRSRGRRGGRGRSRRANGEENSPENGEENAPEQSAEDNHVQSVAEAPPAAPHMNEG